MKKLVQGTKRVQERTAVRHASHGVYVAYYAYAVAENRGFVHLAIVSAILLVHVASTLTGDAA